MLRKPNDRSCRWKTTIRRFDPGPKMPAEENHETLVYRLTSILVKLNSGEKLIPADLADEFGVSIRTIQRDLNVRFSYLPLHKEGGAYRMDTAYLGKFTQLDLDKFASLAGVHGLFPSLNTQFLRKIFDMQLSSAIQVIGHHYEDNTGKEALFSTIEKAITASNNLTFIYEDIDNNKNSITISPYRLMNAKGIWYVCGECEGKLRSFHLAAMEAITMNGSFRKNKSIEDRISNADSIWFSEDSILVRLHVSKKIAKYFTRRKLVPLQEIISEESNGDVIIASTIAHETQILPIVRYWMPHLSIIEPESLKTRHFDIISSFMKTEKQKEETGIE